MNLPDCPSAIVLDEYFAGGLAVGDASQVESHLSSCPHCLSELQRRDALLKSKLLSTAPDSMGTIPLLENSVSSLIRVLKMAGSSTATIDLAETPALDRTATARRANVPHQAQAGLRFQPLRSHAKGGLGEVFVARDSELHREVALKEIQARFAGNEECRARFVSEAEITGNLEHPGIVPVYGLGMYADGRPYYAMRFIRGDNLQAAVDRFHAGAGSVLELRQLLSRFIHVCNAIAYAHSRGVIHRDLKPSNIMLGDFGETLVVDWGLAKIGSAGDAAAGVEPLVTTSGVETLDGRVVGTPAYMSPEQAAGKRADLTSATDIYSLGATLFYVLTAQSPYRGSSVEEVLERVKIGQLEWPTERPVPRPLRAICEQAMAVAPGDRYASALKLAEDLENWLADEPVTAWREPLGVRVRRWMRKNSGVVAATSAAVVVGLLGLGASAAILNVKNQALNTINVTLATSNRKLDQANRDLTESNVKLDHSQKETEKKRQEAESERQIAKAVRNFLQRDLLRQADPVARWDKAADSAPSLATNPTVQELLDRAALELAPEKIETKFPNQPAVQAEILATVGETYRGLGNYAKAREFLERARAITEATLGPDHPTSLDRLTNLANVEGQHGANLPTAIVLLKEVLARHQKSLPPHNKRVLDAKGNLALMYLANDQTDLAVQYFQENLAIEEQEFGADHEQTLGTQLNLGNAFLSQKQPAAAIAELQSAYGGLQRTVGANHPMAMVARTNLAIAYVQVGRNDEALRLMQESVERSRTTLGSDHPITLDALGKLAGLHCDIKQFDKGIELFTQQTERLTAKFGEDYLATLSAKNRLALALYTVKRYDEAIRHFQAVHAVAVNKLGADHYFVIANLSNLATAEVDIQEFAAAAEHYEAVYDWHKARKGENDPETQRFLSNLTICLGFSGQHDRAIPLFEAELAARKKDIGPAHTETLQSMRAFAMSLCRSGAPDRGLALYEEALALEATKFGRGSSVTLNNIGLLAREYLTQKMPEKALPLIEEVIAGQRKLVPPGHPFFIDLYSQLGLDLLKAKEYAAAEPYLREALQRSEQAIKAKQRTNSQYQKIFLGECLLGQSKFAEGEPLIEEGWQGMFKNAVRDNVEPAKLQVFMEGLERLVAVYKSLDLPNEAAKWQMELDARRKPTK